MIQRKGEEQTVPKNRQ